MLGLLILFAALTVGFATAYGIRGAVSRKRRAEILAYAPYLAPPRIKSSADDPSRRSGQQPTLKNTFTALADRLSFAIALDFVVLLLVILLLPRPYIKIGNQLHEALGLKAYHPAPLDVYGKPPADDQHPNYWEQMAKLRADLFASTGGRWVEGAFEEDETDICASKPEANATSVGSKPSAACRTARSAA